MFKRVALGVIATLVFVAPARADLHYTTRTEARPVAPPPGASPMLGVTADLVVRMVLPDGVAETTYWVGAQGTRIEMANGVRTEDAADGGGLGRVVGRRRGAVGVQVADLPGRESRIAQRRAHGAGGAFHRGLRDVARVRAHAEAHNLAVNVCPADPNEA